MFRKSILSLCMLAATSVNAQGYKLTDLINMANSTHPNVVLAATNAEIAKLVVDEAKWQYWPTPSLSVEGAKSSNQKAYAGDDSIKVFRLQQPLYTGGRITSTVDKTESEAVSSRYAYLEARTAISLQTIDAYGQWLDGHLRMQAISRSVQTHQRLMELIERRVAQGLSAESDLILSKTRLAQAQADYEMANSSREGALFSLRQLVGQDFTHEQLAITDALTIKKTLAVITDEVKETSPSRQKLMNDIETAQHNVSIAKASIVPEVYARAEYQSGNYNIPGYGEDTRFYIGVQSNFGAGLSAGSRIAQAQGKVKSAHNEVEKHERQLMNEVLSNFNTYTTIGSRLKALESAQTSAIDVQESWDRQFVTGRKSWLDVMNAAKELAQTEQMIAESKAKVVVSSFKLTILTTKFE